jgi:hypothetical protein
LRFCSSGFFAWFFVAEETLSFFFGSEFYKFPLLLQKNTLNSLLRISKFKGADDNASLGIGFSFMSGFLGCALGFCIIMHFV